MKRDEFLLTTAQLLSIYLISGCEQAPPTVIDTTVAHPRRCPDHFERPILKAIAYGLNAPNPHNTQAWQFKLLSDTDMLFFVDPARLLPATDPPARQIHIGCGCFLAMLQTGMSAHGYGVQIRYFPEGDYTPDTGIGQKPVAHVRLQKQMLVADPLFAYLTARRTNRLAYEGPLLLPSEFARWLSAAQPACATARLVHNPTELTQHLDLLIEAMRVETLTYARHEESRIWFRESDEQMAQHRDGLCLPANGTNGIRKWVAEWLLRGKKPKNWHGSSATGSFLADYDQTSRTAKGLLLLTTPTNTPIDWLQTGIDFARLQLAGIQAGFYIHPMSQVLQEYDEMNTLRQRYELLNQVVTPQKIQMVLRVGRAGEPFLTYRRAVADFVKA
ncbi:Acg family FMN-binding oxidoreductase [Spirosoma arcticum]